MKNKTVLRASLYCGCATFVAAAVPAMAQTTDPQAADTAQATPGAVTSPLATTPASGQQNEQSVGLQDIVVTATKRETNLQKTPIAISVVDPTTIKDRHIQSLIDLADGGVPSLRVATFEARQSALTIGIRGIVPFDQNQTARDTGVGVYIDGVYLGRSQGLNAALFDVDRIEVLKGPQGTLFGRNTEGGALSIVTKAPTGVFDGRVTAGFGNYGSYQTEFHVDLPEVYNIAIKVDGLVQHQDATVKDPLDGSYGWNYYQRYGGRVSAKWQPVSNFSALLSYDKARDENTPNYSQLIDFNPNNYPVGSYNAAGALVCPTGAKYCVRPLAPIVKVTGDNRQTSAEIGVPQQPSVDHTEGFSSTLNWQVAPAIDLRSITAWRDVTTNQWDNSGGAHRTVFSPNGKFSRYSLSDLEQSQFSQEFQLVGNAGQLSYVAGLYYFEEHAQETAATPSSNQWNADGTDYTILSPVVVGPVTSNNQGWDEGDRFLQRGSVAKAHSYAAFAQATYTPDAADMLHLTLGGRYTHDTRHGTLYLVQGKATDFVFDYNNKRFDPMVTVAADLAPNLYVYAKYSTGYRAGGANDRSQTFTAFGPESVKSYELGFKADLLDHRVRFNMDGYIMNRKGTQTDFDNVDTNPASPTYNLHTEETRNAPGLSKIRGIEAELTAKPVQPLTLGVSYAYTYFYVPPTPNPFLANAPFQVYVVYTPRNAVSGFTDFELPAGTAGAKFRLHLDANYSDPVYSFQAEPVKTDSSFIVNGRIAIADIPLAAHGQTLTVDLWSRNLLNETNIYRRSNANSVPTYTFVNGVPTSASYSGVLGDYANFNPPRTFGLEGTISF